jgi:hypothetical protein
MAIKIILGYNDPEFSLYENYFWNFNPDDWDYMIVGEHQSFVEDMAEKLKIFDYDIKLINDLWVAVTYHS